MTKRKLNEKKVNEKLANHHHDDQIQLAKKQMWLDSFRIS